MSLLALFPDASLLLKMNLDHAALQMEQVEKPVDIQVLLDFIFHQF